MPFRTLVDPAACCRASLRPDPWIGSGYGEPWPTFWLRPELGGSAVEIGGGGMLLLQAAGFGAISANGVRDANRRPAPTGS